MHVSNNTKWYPFWRTLCLLASIDIKLLLAVVIDVILLFAPQKLPPSPDTFIVIMQQQCDAFLRKTKWCPHLKICNWNHLFTFSLSTWDKIKLKRYFRKVVESNLLRNCYQLFGTSNVRDNSFVASKRGCWRHYGVWSLLFRD